MKNILRGISHTLAAVTTNCSEFHDAWERAAATRCGLEGRWTGEWHSDANGHHGALRCLVTKTGDREIKTVFHARYGKVLRVCYSVVLQAEPDGEEFQLHGEADLGQLGGGIYTYQATLTSDRFICDYRCEYDHGRFELT